MVTKYASFIVTITKICLDLWPQPIHRWTIPEYQKRFHVKTSSKKTIPARWTRHHPYLHQTGRSPAKKKKFKKSRFPLVRNNTGYRYWDLNKQQKTRDICKEKTWETMREIVIHWNQEFDMVKRRRQRKRQTEGEREGEKKGRQQISVVELLTRDVYEYPSIHMCMCMCMCMWMCMCM